MGRYHHDYKFKKHVPPLKTKVNNMTDIHEEDIDYGLVVNIFENHPLKGLHTHHFSIGVYDEFYISHEGTNPHNMHTHDVIEGDDGLYRTTTINGHYHRIRLGEPSTSVNIKVEVEDDRSVEAD